MLTENNKIFSMATTSLNHFILSPQNASSLTFSVNDTRKHNKPVLHFVDSKVAACSRVAVQTFPIHGNHESGIILNSINVQFSINFLETLNL